jgi:hypothetical protein
VRKGLLWILGVWLLSAGRLFAQAAPATNPPEANATPESNTPAKPASEAATPPSVSMVEDVAVYRGWAQVDYLFWWLKNAPLPVPLVTTGDPRVGFDPNLVNTVNTAGAIGQPGTRVLFGDQDIHSQGYSGMRFALGSWIDEADVFGTEGSGFILERRTKRFVAASDATGNPPFYFPIFSASVGAERAIPIADPLRGFSGDAVINSTLQLWGAEINGLLNLYHNAYLDLTLLSGFRYADLRENIEIYNTTKDLIFGNVTSLTDYFRTVDQFYGGQLGSRLAVQIHRFSLDITGKVALGATHQVVDIQGNIIQAGPNAPVPPGVGIFPGGVFTQSSNIGKRSADQFAVLPSLELKCGFALNPRARIFAGYDLLYWSQVVRPGNQISSNVNLTQNAVLDPNGQGKLVGPAQPAPLFNRSEFWAQGINAGLEIRY